MTILVLNKVSETIQVPVREPPSPDGWETLAYSVTYYLLALLKSSSQKTIAVN